MALELGQALRVNGEDVVFLASCWNNNDFLTHLQIADLPAKTLHLGFISAKLTTRCLRMTGEQIWHLPELYWRYEHLLRAVKPKRVIHTNWHHLLLLLPFLRSDRDIYWLHEFVPNCGRYRRVFGLFARRLRCFVCVSQAVAGSLRQLGISESQIHVIHNGITDPGLAQSRWPSAPFRIGIIGQVGAWKGHDDLLIAFSLAHRRFPNCELHVFGNGERGYREQLELKCGELGIWKSVNWHEFVPDRSAIYSNLDLCVVPSRSQDPLPTTAIEAGFSGLPVIATRRGGLPEIIEDEVNGLLVEAERPAEIAGAICRLLADRELWRRLSHNARLFAAERFGRERFAREFCAVLSA